MVRVVILFLFSVLLIGCSAEEQMELGTTRQALATECTILLGGNGLSQSISHSFTDYTDLPYLANTSTPWTFIRNTSGYCKFTVYSDYNQTGDYIVLGTDLTNKIRAGRFGLLRFDETGNDTWDVKSVKIEPLRFTSCFVNIGGRSRRMNYYPGEYDRVPKMDKLSYFWGGNCDALGWNDPLFGENDSDNRFVGIHTNAISQTQADSREVYDPGFDIESLNVRLWGISNCSSDTYLNRDYGRCLPHVNLDYTAYSNNVNFDKDKDGLHDYVEDLLAEAFVPIVHNHSTENATRPYLESDIINNTQNSYPYLDVNGNPVIEPVVAFQVRKSPLDLDNMIEIVYVQMWKEDIYDAISCPGHHGDTQPKMITIKTPPADDPLHGHFWWVIATGQVNLSRDQTGDALDNNDGIQEDFWGIPVDSPEFHHVITEEEIRSQEEHELLCLQNDAFCREFTEEDPEVDETNKYSKIYNDNSNKHSSTRVMDGSDDDVYDEFTWQQGDTHLRAPIFDRLANETAHTNKHFSIYYTKGKHHMYQDTKFAGETDKKYCKEIQLTTIYCNGKGEIHSPSYPKRLLNIRSPENKGDSYNYNNVGSRDHYNGFLDSLTYLGFPNMRIWRDVFFYSGNALAANRWFTCANNVNQLCCMEGDPGCTIPPTEIYWCAHHKDEGSVAYFEAVFLGCNLQTYCFAEEACDDYSPISNWRDYLDPTTIPVEN